MVNVTYSTPIATQLNAMQSTIGTIQSVVSSIPTNPLLSTDARLSGIPTTRPAVDAQGRVTTSNPGVARTVTIGQ
jgi:hypothetical protein